MFSLNHSLLPNLAGKPHVEFVCMVQHIMPFVIGFLTITVSDGCTLAYNEIGPPDGKILILIHGWSGSHRYFDLVGAGLAEQEFRVILPDLRFHGDSDKPAFGLHVHRLAADLKELLEKVAKGKKATVLGTSMGCAVIWAFIELFGTKMLNGACFVDQAPLQNRMPDWQIGSKGCYDLPTLDNMHTVILGDFEAFADGTVADCLNTDLPPEYVKVLRSETLKCSPEQLWGLMRDHTQLDWRPTLPNIDVPCLNLYGGASKVFPVEGCAYLGEKIPNCVSKMYEGCNHWLYMEKPAEFVADVSAFALSL